MTDSRYVAAALFAIPALVWAIMARQLFGYRRLTASQSHMIRLAPYVVSALAVHIGVHVLWILVPEDVPPSAATRVLEALLDGTGLVAFAFCRHALRVTPIPERPPSRRWLALNYGVTGVVAAAVMIARLVPGIPPERVALVHALSHVTGAGLVGLCLLELARVARPSAWGPESAGELRQPDLLLILGGSAASIGAAAALAVAGFTGAARVFLEVGISLAIAAPFALRMLGFVLAELAVTVGMLAALGVLLAADQVVARHSNPALVPLVHASALAALGFVAIPGQAWLRALTDRLVVGRSRRQQAELLAFLDTLPPTLGALECCRRALDALVRVRHLRGAAVILRDGETLVHGDFAVEPLARVWPRGDASDALPAQGFGTAELRELPLVLREALIAANVGLGVAPLVSPRRRWGHVFMNTGLLGGTFREDDADAFRAFVGKLALLFDGADLLARAVAVERSLAHAEKLAAIGELSARIAHEIRNPVTAARSLAQQLAREPGATGTAELGLILAELERVERQVAALLRFARREEFAFEPVDLGDLVRGTIETYRPRLEAAHIGVELDLAPAVVAPVDREKLRQVLVYLVENALDALGDAPGPRRLAFAVARTNGAARLRVADSGPGVPAEALDHVFEPFFSTKPAGTGLGLAIARRTVEAHGGRIAAASTPGHGTIIEIELPPVHA